MALSNGIVHILAIEDSGVLQSVSNGFYHILRKSIQYYKCMCCRCREVLKCQLLQDDLSGNLFFGLHVILTVSAIRRYTDKKNIVLKLMTCG